MFVYIILNSVWVAEWPFLGKELPTLLTICFPCTLTICIFCYFPFCFEGRIWVLVAPVPGLCILVTFTLDLGVVPITVYHFSYALLFQGLHFRQKCWNGTFFLKNYLLTFLFCLMIPKKIGITHANRSAS